MVRMLRSLGIAPDMAYYASLGSIVLSLALWFLPRSANNRERPGQLAIFVGLWAPTLMLLGHALETHEQSETGLTRVSPSDAATRAS